MKRSIFLFTTLTCIFAFGIILSTCGTESEFRESNDISPDAMLGVKQSALVQGDIFCDVNLVGGSNDGTSWENAFSDLQEAIYSANSGQNIYVKEGVYSGATFILKPGINIYGGFESDLSNTEGDPEARDLINHKSRIDGLGSLGAFVFSENNILDGFVIENGFVSTGGILFFTRASSATMRNCVVQNNAVVGMGAIVFATMSDINIENCYFRNNSFVGLGGLLFNTLSTSNVINTVFVNNAAWHPSAIYNTLSTMNIINSTLYHDSAVDIGGAIVNNMSTLKIRNSILWSNPALFWGPQITNLGWPLPSVQYSNVKGHGWGTGNIDQSPLFQDPANGDLRLTENSPCIDRGNANVAPEKDILWQTRYDELSTPNIGVGIPVYTDLGAYEYRPPCPPSTEEFDLDECMSQIAPRQDLTGEKKELDYQERLLQCCLSPGLDSCMTKLYAKASSDRSIASMTFLDAQITGSQYLGLARDRTRKLQRAEDDPAYAQHLCYGVDSDNDWIPDDEDSDLNTPQLMPTDDNGVQTSLPQAPDDNTVRDAVFRHGLTISHFCQGVTVPGLISPGGFYWINDSSKGVYLVISRAKGQNPGCPLYYQFEVVGENYQGDPVHLLLTFKDGESVSGLVGLPKPVPSSFIQFQVLPSDSGDRGTLANDVKPYIGQYRVRAYNGKGLTSPWSNWRSQSRVDCLSLGFDCI